LSKGRNFTINSFDIVAVYGHKVKCCFDIVAGVDGALAAKSWMVKWRCDVRFFLLCAWSWSLI